MSDLDRLTRFAAVAELLSFSAAARRLRVDQPWLSRQIQQLETQLGFPLFVRSTRTVALTREGEELYEKARELARCAEDCRNTAKDLSRAHEKVLALGVHPSTFWIAARRRIIETAQQRDSRVTIKVSSYYSRRLVSRLRNRSLDAAIVSQPFECPDFEYQLIYDSRLKLLVPPEDPLAATKSVPISALAGRQVPLLNPNLYPPAWEALYQPFVDAGLVPLTVKEGDVAIPFYAKEMRLPVISKGTHDVEHNSLRDFVAVELEGDVPHVQFALARRAEEPRALLLHFWNNACRLIEEEELVSAEARELFSVRHPRGGAR